MSAGKSIGQLLGWSYYLLAIPSLIAPPMDTWKAITIITFILAMSALR